LKFNPLYGPYYRHIGRRFIARFVGGYLSVFIARSVVS